MLRSPQLISVPRPDGSLLLIQQILQAAGDPQFVVGVAAGLGWQGGMFTGSDVFCDAVRDIIYVLPMEVREKIPIRCLKAVL